MKISKPRILKSIPNYILWCLGISALLSLVTFTDSNPTNTLSENFKLYIFETFNFTFFLSLICWACIKVSLSISTHGTLKFKIIEGYKRNSIARFFPDKGIYYKREFFKPLSISNQNNTNVKDQSSTLANAAVGGLVFGGAGAVVGAISGGNKSETIFTMELEKSGSHICSIETKFYPALLAEMSNFKKAENRLTAST